MLAYSAASRETRPHSLQHTAPWAPRNARTHHYAPARNAAAESSRSTTCLTVSAYQRPLRCVAILRFVSSAAMPRSVIDGNEAGAIKLSGIGRAPGGMRHSVGFSIMSPDPLEKTADIAGAAL